jgi:hypothetical protein
VADCEKSCGAVKSGIVSGDGSEGCEEKPNASLFRFRVLRATRDISKLET